MPVSANPGVHVLRCKRMRRVIFNYTGNVSSEVYQPRVRGRSSKFLLHLTKPAATSVQGRAVCFLATSVSAISLFPRGETPPDGVHPGRVRQAPPVLPSSLSGRCYSWHRAVVRRTGSISFVSPTHNSRTSPAWTLRSCTGPRDCPPRVVCCRDSGAPWMDAWARRQIEGRRHRAVRASESSFGGAQEKPA